MACGGCGKGGGARHTGTGGDLKQFAFLTPRQLRYLKSKEPPVAEEQDKDKKDE